MRENLILQTFNRGVVSKYALGRTDIKRTGLSAEIQTNWISRVLGPMSLRPGLGYLGSSRSNLTAKHIPFIYSNDDLAIVEVTEDNIRVLIDDVPISRVSVSTSILNSAFTTNLTDWTDADEAGATSDHAVGGYMSLTGTRYAAAIRTQQVSVIVGDQNREHGLRITVHRGNVLLRVGSSSGAQDYISEQELGEGVHSLAFTPTGANFHIWLGNRAETATLVDSVVIESAGDVTVTSPWAEEDLGLLRWTQSADVIFVACEGYQQRRIERRGTRSWSVVRYYADNGPFRLENTTSTSLTPSALSGDITLTASTPLFDANHVGALFRITSIGQTVEASFTAENQFSDDIRVTGVGATRGFNITITGTWSATITLQRSIGETGSWVDVPGWSFIANYNNTYTDGLDNQIVFYRIGVKTGNFTSGQADVSMTYSSGGITGIVRITGVTTSTSASARVLTNLGSTSSSEVWAEGEWSNYRGYPSSVEIFEGRLWWAGLGKAWGSVSDAYDNFDPDYEGDAGPISRNVGSGPVRRANWLIGLSRLGIGTDGAEYFARSSNFDEPLSPTNFNPKAPSTQGSALVAAVKCDTRGYFVQKSRRRLYELGYNGQVQDYESTDLTVLCPEIATDDIVHIAIQRQPDTRIHCVLDDGTVALLIMDKAEDVVCWLNIETDGDIEDAFVLPGEVEDAVYYLVARSINGSTVRYLEKWAMMSECVGGTINKQADSFVTFTNGPASATVTGLSHLEGESVVVWADGKCMRTSAGEIATFTVASGSITLTNAGSSYAATTGIVGLAYNATYKSMKPAAIGQNPAVLNQKQRIVSVGLVLGDTHAKGLKYGPDFDTMDALPGVEAEQNVDPDYIWTSFDREPIAFPGEWRPDSRVCLKAQAPRPATVLAVACVMDYHTR